MSKSYQAPILNFEPYNLASTPTTNCQEVVSNGPAVGGHKPCEEFSSPFPTLNRGLSPMSNPHNVDFYDTKTCDCYTTGAGRYWTS